MALVISAVCAGGHAQSSFTAVGGEYGIVGPLGVEQTRPHTAFDSSGGWVVWQDNGIDGQGTGIGARRLDANLSGDLGSFRVNSVAAGEQERPQVALLSDGGAAFVWQGGRPGFQKIFARFMSASGVFASGDVMVNTFTNQHQIQPVISRLNNGNVAIVWSSFSQDGSLLGIYGQIMSGAGVKVGSEFRINQTTNLNQRTPSIALLNNGNFVVTWVSESFRTPDATDPRDMDAKIFGRIFTPAGTAVDAEFAVNAGSAVCANPSVAATSDGFVVVWGRKDAIDVTNSWDVIARGFSLGGLPVGGEVRVNSELVGEQFFPTVAAAGTNCFVAWSSLGQDGSYEGVYGRAVNSAGATMGPEIRVNSTTINKQLNPSATADSSGRFLVTWAGFVGGARGFDLFAQRYSTDATPTLPPPSIPYVSALNSGALSVTWPALAGYSVDFYELYVDDSSTGIVVNGLQYTVTNLAPSSTHTFRVLYQLTSGERSPLSGQASGTTWGADSNGDGLPDDWQTGFWGNTWPDATADSDGDGASNLAEFLAGTDPSDAGSVLRTRLHRSGATLVFSWNTQPGFIYQVHRADTIGAWQPLGSPRFAHGIVDSITLPGGNSTSFYRVTRLR